MSITRLTTDPLKYPASLIAHDAEIIMDHDFADGNFGHWRDHISNDPDGYHNFPPNYMVNWPTDSGYSLGISTHFDPRANGNQTNVPGTSRKPINHAASAYWNSSRDPVEGRRYLTFMMKYAFRQPDDSKRVTFTIGVDTQAWDNSWRVFPRLVGTTNYRGYTWGVRESGASTNLYRGDPSTTLPSLGNTPMLGGNEEKSNTGWIGLRIDLDANNGQGGYDGVYTPLGFHPCRLIGEGKNGAETPQVASPFAGGLNFGILISNSGTPDQITPAELIVLRTIAWAEGVSEL